LLFKGYVARDLSIYIVQPEGDCGIVLVDGTGCDKRPWKLTAETAGMRQQWLDALRPWVKAVVENGNAAEVASQLHLQNLEEQRKEQHATSPAGPAAASTPDASPADSGGSPASSPGRYLERRDSGKGGKATLLSLARSLSLLLLLLLLLLHHSVCLTVRLTQLLFALLNN
jgi:hypothetical protein